MENTKNAGKNAENEENTGEQENREYIQNSKEQAY